MHSFISDQEVSTIGDWRIRSDGMLALAKKPSEASLDYKIVEMDNEYEGSRWRFKLNRISW